MKRERLTKKRANDDGCNKKVEVAGRDGEQSTRKWISLNHFPL